MNWEELFCPSSFAATWESEIKDSLEIFVDENTIILQKYEPADIFTGSMDDLIDYKGKKVSKASILEMARIAGLDVK